MRDKRYTDEDISAIIAELIDLFEAASDAYKLALTGRESNRSTKELLRGSSRGTVIHRYQCDFAWILHDIRCGPLCHIEDNINEAHELINHLKKIAH